ncbi:MAG: hypothetical protein M3O70_08680 [Actinomycetota bacterium]|nr:hypothetical protein [Actinomycetota bacterium]
MVVAGQGCGVDGGGERDDGRRDDRGLAGGCPDPGQRGAEVGGLAERGVMVSPSEAAAGLLDEGHERANDGEAGQDAELDPELGGLKRHQPRSHQAVATPNMMRAGGDLGAVYREPVIPSPPLTNSKPPQPTSPPRWPMCGSEVPATSSRAPMARWLRRWQPG